MHQQLGRSAGISALGRRRLLGVAIATAAAVSAFSPLTVVRGQWGTLENTCLVLVLVLLIPLAITRPALAQPDGTADSGALIEALTRNLDVYDSVLGPRADLLERERALRVELERLAAELQALALPEAPSMAAPPGDLDAAGSLARQWSARREAQADHQRLLGARRDRLDEHRNVALKLAHEDDVLGEIAEVLAPLLVELDRRLEAGDLTADDHAAIAGRLPEDGLIADAVAGKWRDAASRDDSEVEITEHRLEVIAAAITAEADHLATAETWLREASIRNEILLGAGSWTYGELLASLLAALADFERVRSALRLELDPA